MLNTTLCYITRGDQVLMLYRIKKKMILIKISGSVWAENFGGRNPG